ncbi:MAG: LysR substrate-binding domain-containing protein [Pseudomonadota bacterium]
MLADIAGSFVERYARVSTEWLLDDTPCDLLAEGVDLWIRVGRISDESLTVRGLWQIERAIVAAGDSPYAPDQPDELADRTTVLLGPYVGQDISLTGPDDATVTLMPLPAISTDNIFVAERLTLAGHRYSILPLWLMPPRIETGAARHLCADWQPQPLPLSLAYPQARFQPVRHGLSIEHLKERLPESGAGISHVP